MPRHEPSSLPVEIFAQGVNGWIIRTPGRRFPALVIQGDSFHSLFALAQSLLDRARLSDSPDSELVEEAEELRDALWSRLSAYEETLAMHELERPYNRIAQPE